MATVLTPPIDLYAETQDLYEESAGKTPHDAHITPRENGERDEPAIEKGESRLEQVLGW